MRREEEAAQAEAAASGAGDDAETSEDEVVHEVAEAIRTKKAMVIARSRRAKGSNHPRLNRAAFGVSTERFKADMGALGVDAEVAASHMKEGKKRARSISKRDPSVGAEDDMVDDDTPKRGRSLPRPGFRSPRGASSSRAPSDEPRSRSRSRARNASQGEPIPGEGFKDAKQKVCGHKGTLQPCCLFAFVLLVLHVCLSALVCMLARMC